MKKRLISIMLSLIMTMSAVQPAFAVGESLSPDELFSAEPKDMTPVEQDYSPGLGDRNDAVSYTAAMGWLGSSTGLAITQTYEDALKLQEMVANITNGAHQVAYTLGQDILRWGSSPYLIEDPSYPMGDGTPGSGYAKYNKYVEDSFKNNTDVCQILEPLLAGSMRDDYASEEEKIPLSCYTHDENGNKKIGWTAGDEYWYLLSLHNLYETGYAQKAWQRMQDTWNFRTHVYYDAMIPVPEGLYNNPNLTTMYGGAITNTEMEWDAVQREIKYSWENFAISSGQEYIHPKYKGLSCAFSVPYGVITDKDYLETWGNSVVIGKRADNIQSIVWGSELGAWDYGLELKDNNKWDAFVTRLMDSNLQYLYMLQRKPLDYTNNPNVYQVEFSGDLVSSYDKKTGNYTLIEGGDFVIADGGDRFIPQVGAGCKIYAYSHDSKTRTWKLPDTWNGVKEVDRYILSLKSAPAKVDTIAVTNDTVTLNMTAKTVYLLVPKGDAPTPKTANFNELAPGTTLGTYQMLGLGVTDGTDFKVYEASANGGFGSPSIYADSSDTSAIMQIDMEDGAILHSLKIGNKGGEGRVVLHSSNPLNPDVMIELPKKDQVYKFNTSWVYGETDVVTVKIENSDEVSNVLFDAIMYSETSRVQDCVHGNHEYIHHHVEPICGTDGRDSDVCEFCGNEINVTVYPAIEGEHNFTDSEVLLTATAYNTGVTARFCLKCGYKTETETPKTTSTTNLAFHHDFGNNYMQTNDIRPYDKSNGTVVFDVLPLDVSARSNPSGPCYIGVWFGKSYSMCAAYDFAQQKFVIGNNSMEFKTSITNPLASKSYSWIKNSDGNYPMHRFAFKLVGNTAKIYLDGVEMLSYTDTSFASRGDILLMYTKGECIIDNIVVSDSNYDVATGSGSTIMKVDFENGSEALSGWTLGGYITTDIREFDMNGYFSDDHTHVNALVASHEATYFHGSYDEYECSLCHKRTINETGDVLVGDVLVHMSLVVPTCTDEGRTEYWYDRNGTRYSDAAGNTVTTLENVTVAALGHDLTYHPAVAANNPDDSFVEYWTCSRCKKNFADEEGKNEISLVKTDATREVEKAIASIGKIKYNEESKVNGSGFVGTFTTGEGNSNYSVLDVGNAGSKLNADYTVEMLIRIRDVDKETEIGGGKGAFFGLACENFTVGYDFISEKWGVSPISGLFASYAFQPSETGPSCVLDDGYFHNIKFECTTEAIRVYVDDVCVLNVNSVVRENNRYCIFYPRLCTVEFASYAFMYNGKWVNDHLTGIDMINASTWKDKGTGFGTTVETFIGSTLIDSLRAIENAESMYNALSANEKFLVSNYDVLVKARTTYDWLKTAPLYGDVNDDGDVNVYDVTSILKYIAKWNIEINTELADVNCDGAISIPDVTKILKYLAKWDVILGM